MPEITTETLNVRDVELFLRRAGDGETLLLLHGANGNMSWLPVMKALAETHHVILPDHPGFGATPAPDWMDNIFDMTYFYLDVVETLGINDFHLAGHSMGGWIAAEIGIRDANRIKSLTIVSAAGIRVEGTPMGDLFAWSPQEAIKQVYAQNSFREQMLAMEPDEDQIQVMLQNRQMAARLCWTPRLHNPDLAKWLHRLDLPTLILWGNSDGIFPEPYAHAWHDAVPGSELEVYENCGHSPMVEARDAFLARLTAFTQGAA